MWGSPQLWVTLGTTGLTAYATLERTSAKEPIPSESGDPKGAMWVVERSEEVLEGALLNALDLLRRLDASRRVVGEIEDTVFADSFNRAFVIRTLRDAAAHIRSCQLWHAES